MRRFKISVCKNYDPTKTKEYNNNKVAYGWETFEKDWSKAELLSLTTKNGISGNEYITDHKTKSNWKETHVLMYDFDNGKMTTDMLVERQSKWPYSSYVFSSQNHRRTKIATDNKKVEAAHDRLRVLIPLSTSIKNDEEHLLVEEYLLATINKDVDYIDKTFMHKHRYFAHGTDEVSSFVGGKAKPFLNWKTLPGLNDIKNAKEKSSKKPDARGRPKKSSTVFSTFRSFWEVKTKNGKTDNLNNLEAHTEILCPMCGDDKSRGTPGAINAVYEFNENGEPFIYCSSCESRNKGVSGKGIYNLHPTDKFLTNCLEKDFIIFRDAEMGDLIAGVHKIDPSSGEAKWGYRKMCSKDQAIEVLTMHGVDKPAFFPHLTYELRFDINKIFDFERNFVNKYVPTKFFKISRPAQSSAGMPKYVGHVLSHVFAGDKDVMKHYINELADHVQTRKKRRTAFLLQGTEGTGKGLWFNRVLKPIFGRDYCNEMDQGPFLNNFNSSLENNVLTLVNECRANFTNSRGQDTSIVEKIKIAISDSDIEIERKGKDRYNGRNNCSFMFATNRLKAVVLPMDDRRFTIAPRQETKIEKTKWWPGGNEVERRLSKEIQKFLWFLLDYKVDKKKIGAVISNDAKRIIQALSLTNAEEFFNAIKRGDNLWFEENIIENPGYRGEDDYIEIQTLFKAIKKANYISKGNLCRLYNYVVHPNKPVSMASFGKSAVAHLPDFKPCRINGKLERGIRVDWDN